jgi:hypothetical protein
MYGPTVDVDLLLCLRAMPGRASAKHRRATLIDFFMLFISCDGAVYLVVSEAEMAL